METFVDDLSRAIAAPPERTWAAIVAVVGRLSLASPLASALACVPGAASESWAGRPGESVVGFAVTRADPPRRLELHGHHRFASYTLVFELTEQRLHARTFADFPGLTGRLYRALVIGSGGHHWAVQSMLRAVARRAERS